MKQTKSNSYNSTPFSSKENICPNAKFNNLHENKKQLTPSMGTDPQFSIFNTINVPGMSHNSITTKSRVDMEAIIEDFSNRHSKSHKEGPHSHKEGPHSHKGGRHSHKSFLALLGLAIGKEEFSMEQAIDKCEQYEITNRDQLLSIIQSKQPTREWPLPLSNLLLTDLGQLKIMNLCNRLDDEEDLSEHQVEILQFLLPKINCIHTIDRSLVLDCYHDFSNKIDEKFSLVDGLVKEYSLRIQPKIRIIQDKILLIKVQKRFRKFEKIHRDQINYSQLKSCLEGLGLLEEECLMLFKYLYFLENDRVMEMVDRKQVIKVQTCIKEILDKGQISFVKPTVSRIELMGQENTQVINDLLQDKTHLLNVLDENERQILKLNNHITLLQLKLQNQRREAEQQKQREVQAMRSKYLNRIKNLEMENGERDRMIGWYKNQLDGAVHANQAEVISKHKQQIYRQMYHSTKNQTK